MQSHFEGIKALTDILDKALLKIKTIKDKDNQKFCLEAHKISMNFLKAVQSFIKTGEAKEKQLKNLIAWLKDLAPGGGAFSQLFTLIDEVFGPNFRKKMYQLCQKVDKPTNNKLGNSNEADITDDFVYV